jgi:hypothetical protein
MMYQAAPMRSRRRIGFTSALAAGAAAAAALAMTASSPLANADTADLPDFPQIASEPFNQESLGVPPLFDGYAFEYEGSYTDLLGDSVTEDDPSDGALIDTNGYGFPGTGDPSLIAEEAHDPISAVVVLSNKDIVEGSTFGFVGAPDAGFYNLYEETPFVVNGGGIVDNIDDVFAYEPSGYANSDSAIDFGIQYLDLPDAATPVDEINLLGSGGEILFSIPVTGDLFAL